MNDQEQKKDVAPEKAYKDLLDQANDRFRESDADLMMILEEFGKLRKIITALQLELTRKQVTIDRLIGSPKAA